MAWLCRVSRAVGGVMNGGRGQCSGSTVRASGGSGNTGTASSAHAHDQPSRSEQTRASEAEQQLEFEITKTRNKNRNQHTEQAESSEPEWLIVPGPGLGDSDISGRSLMPVELSDSVLQRNTQFRSNRTQTTHTNQETYTPLHARAINTIMASSRASPKLLKGVYLFK